MPDLRLHGRALTCVVTVQVLSDGHVYFTNEGKQRPSAEAALQHPFLAPAFNPDLTPEEMAEGTVSSTGSRNWLGLFSLVQNRVTDLEDEISRTVRLLIRFMSWRESTRVNIFSFSRNEQGWPSYTCHSHHASTCLEEKPHWIHHVPSSHLPMGCLKLHQQVVGICGECDTCLLYTSPSPRD